jgi:hypothetical protein
MDDIAAAQSRREIEHLRRDVRGQLGSHPRLGELERMLDAQQRLLNGGEASAESDGSTGTSA